MYKWISQLSTIPDKHQRDVIEQCQHLLESFHCVQDTEGFIETSQQGGQPRTGLVFLCIELETNMMEKYNAMISRMEKVCRAGASATDD